MIPALRLGVRLANPVFFVLCSFLVADLANQVSAGLLEPVEVGVPPPAPVVARPAPTWSDRQAILDRDLFGTGDVQVVVEEPPEEIEKTELRIDLLGTLASSDRDTRMASIWYEQRREYEVLRPGDRLDHLPNVELARVERGRVILRNGDALEALSLDDRERVSRGSAKAAAIRKELRRRRRSIRNR